jgi:hypothetical protein
VRCKAFQLAQAQGDVAKHDAAVKAYHAAPPTPLPPLAAPQPPKAVRPKWRFGADGARVRRPSAKRSRIFANDGVRYPFGLLTHTQREWARERGDAIALAVDSDAWRRLAGDYRPRTESLGVFSKTAVIRRHRELRRLFFFPRADRPETLNPRIRFVPRDRRERDLIAVIERSGDRTIRAVSQTNTNNEEASRAAAREAILAEVSRIDRELGQYHANTAAKQALREVRERLLAAYRALAE